MEKINVFVALAPVLQMHNSDNPIYKSMADNIDDIQWWFDALNIDSIFGPSWNSMQSKFCWWNTNFCTNLDDFKDRTIMFN